MSMAWPYHLREPEVSPTESFDPRSWDTDALIRWTEAIEKLPAPLASRWAITKNAAIEELNRRLDPRSNP